MAAAALIAGGLALALLWAWHVGRRWSAVERVLAARLPLGSDGVIRGAAAIRHVGPARAALFLHGFGDTPQSLAWLAGRVAEAGWTVFVPLLPGHGRTLRELNRSGAAQWRGSARLAYRELAREHSPVVVCGQSMGAALALLVAAGFRVPALVLISPYLRLPKRARALAALWPVAQWIAPVVRTYDARSIQDPEAAAESLAFGYTSPKLLWQLWRVVRRAQRDLRKVVTATLVIHSREDNRVPAEAVVRAVDEIAYPVKALRWVSGCGHVVSVDHCKEAVAAKVIEWLERSDAHATTPAAR